MLIVPGGLTAFEHELIQTRHRADRRQGCRPAESLVGLGNKIALRARTRTFVQGPARARDQALHPSTRVAIGVT